MFNPAEDGATHINVYSKGRTPLGRFLSHFERWAFEHPQFGRFECVEGLWYWLSCAHPDRDQLRTVWGWKAKELGRKLRGSDWQRDPEFKRHILDANWIKISTHPAMREELRRSTLPLTHYYVYDGVVRHVPEAAWILDGLNNIRHHLKGISMNQPLPRIFLAHPKDYIERDSLKAAVERILAEQVKLRAEVVTAHDFFQRDFQRLGGWTRWIAHVVTGNEYRNDQLVPCFNAIVVGPSERIGKATFDMVNIALHVGKPVFLVRYQAEGDYGRPEWSQLHQVCGAQQISPNFKEWGALVYL